MDLGRPEEKFTPRKLLVFIVEIILAVMLILSAVSLVQLYWISPIGVYGPSMEGTLHTGDMVYINKSFGSVSRGDVVVVYLPKDYTYDQLGLYTGANDDTERCPASRTKTFDDFIANLPFFGKGKTSDDSDESATINYDDDYYMVIKRVIALPGETVQRLEGKLTVEGVTVGTYVSVSQNFMYTLGPDEYFILGDNRGVSKDSSFYGPIRGNWIYGKVFAAHVYDIGREKWTWKTNI